MPLKSGRASAPNLVREGLRAAIIDGTFVSGAKLSQDEIATRFGTSRIPVREALRQLETEGLVDIVPNRGAVVAGLSFSDAIAVMDIRIGLECRALELAVPNLLDDDVEAADRVLAEYDGASNPEKWGEMNWRFHRILYDPCDRPRLVALIEQNVSHIGRFTRTHISRLTGKGVPQRDHYDILAACRRGDPARATRVLREHLLRTQKILMAAARMPG